ncbi:MAG: LamG-like jellyroll fold domain-containing protein [Fuerstiella sp.]
MDEALQQLIFKAIDQTITEDEFEQLQSAIENHDDVRDQYLAAVSLSQALSEIANAPEALESTTAVSGLAFSKHVQANGRSTRSAFSIKVLLAIACLLLVSLSGYWFGKSTVVPATNPIAAAQDTTEESLLAGHATLRRSVDLQWSKGAQTYRDGEILPNGRLQFEAGVMEIDFFCGATLIVEGPAILDVKSDWLVAVEQGRLRANVPPAARGFIVKAAGSDIIDLGTEFALSVDSINAQLEVIDGEIKIQGGKFDGNHLTTGQTQRLMGSESQQSTEQLSTLAELQVRRQDAEAARFSQWQALSERLSHDERLVAYFPIARSQLNRFVPNETSAGTAFDGKLVGPVGVEHGRFGPESTGLTFNRPGSRVRTLIDGDFTALTFACWVRIDSLEHTYNALFMSDGYETGELHWQIRNDGRVMFSVMVDDTQSRKHFSKVEQRIVETAGLARVYYSDPIWDVSKSGQWIHLAVSYDPANRIVVQYANGERMGAEEIKDQFYIDTLRIGPAEIGNWGQPFRKTPSFAVRNLNGSIDEMAIFGAPLSADEIKSLYEQGRPLGY